jgi:negative elongation factor C/D
MSLLELEAKLREKDAIMEQNTCQTLREYVAAGGKPATAIDLLSDNYRGAWADGARFGVCAQARVRRRFARVSGGRRVRAALQRLRAARMRLHTPHAHTHAHARTGYAQMTSLVCRWLEDTSEAAPPASEALGGAGPSSASASAPPPPAGAAAPTPDEYHFAQSVVRERFDGALVDAAMNWTAVPAWFLSLMASPRGRSLLYALAEQHRACNTLGLAISLAWQRGHVDEVSRLGATAAASFDIFHGVLTRRLAAVLDAGCADARAEAVEELRRLCGGSPATYLFTQMLLGKLGGEPGGAPLRRLAQELERGVPGATSAALLRRMAPLLARSGADAAAVIAAGAVVEAAEAHAPHATLTAAAGRLWNVYKASAGIVIEAGATTAGDDGDAAGGGGDADMQDDGMGADAGAADATAMEDDAARAPTPPPPDAPGGAGGGVEGPGLEPLRVPAVLHALLHDAFSPSAARAPGAAAPPPPSASARGGLPASMELLALSCAAPGAERSATRSALAAAARLAASASQGAAPDPHALSQLVSVPVAAAGMVTWVRAELADADFYRRVHAGAALSAYVGLLSAAAAAAPGTHPAIVDALAAALRVLGRGAPDRAEELLGVAPVLLRAGCVAPTLAAAERWAAADADPSLVRSFLASALAVAAPPYSRDFAAAVLRLCGRASMKRGAAAVDTFATAVARAKGAWAPPLGAEEESALATLRS